ncbi:MAG TPA: PP2C family protein-serine/threonine phosphatase [Bryobacteraceae bacterium]|nr:PP2C family protein-serine/threonine phosphatase [Bryobacteraceae bacterium]
MKRPKSLLFQLAAATGLGLAVLLMVETLLTYRYVSTRMARDQALLQAFEEASSLEHQLHREHIATSDGLRQILADIVEDRSDEIGWMSVIDAGGAVLATSRVGDSRPSFPSEEVHASTEQNRTSSTVQDLAQGQVLIALLPLLRERTGTSSEPSSRWRMLEIAIYLRGPQGVLHPLNRALLTAAVAALALLASMIVFLVRFKAYVRGRALAVQLELARDVQRRLLPRPGPTMGVEFAGECRPADEVGGDFYDVFRTAQGEIALVLADVSGKGLAAALRMGIVHGAIRALSRDQDGTTLPEMAGALNELLKDESSREFVTLFWAFYDPATHRLRYVNAGHLPPLLLAANSEGVRRLDTGGPVLGLLPNVIYHQESVTLNGEEVLIAYSDGLMEATSPKGDEFGEAGVLSAVRGSVDSAEQMVQDIMGAAVRFMNGAEFHDDLTIFVVRPE